MDGRMEGRRPSSASEKQCINKHSPRSYYVPSPMLGIVQRQGSKIRIPSPIPIPIHKEFTVCLGRKVWRLSLVPEEAQVRGKIRNSSSILSTSWTLPLLSQNPEEERMTLARLPVWPVQETPWNVLAPTEPASQ